MKAFLRRERRLLIALLLLLVLSNVPYGRQVLYPFTLFSTWVHEMCHGIAAYLVGGKVSRLKVFGDGSGLAYTSYRGTRLRSAFVACAGYTGTPLIGGGMLLVRRWPDAGSIGLRSPPRRPARIWDWRSASRDLNHARVSRAVSA